MYRKSVSSTVLVQRARVFVIHEFLMVLLSPSGLQSMFSSSIYRGPSHILGWESALDREYRTVLNLPNSMTLQYSFSRCGDPGP